MIAPNIKTNSIPSSLLFSLQNNIFLFCPNSYYQFGYYNENKCIFSKFFQYSLFESFINKKYKGNINLLKELLNDACIQILIDKSIEINFLLLILNNNYISLEMYEKIIKHCNKKHFLYHQNNQMHHRKDTLGTIFSCLLN